MANPPRMGSRFEDLDRYLPQAEDDPKDASGSRLRRSRSAIARVAGSPIATFAVLALLVSTSGALLARNVTLFRTPAPIEGEPRDLQAAPVPTPEPRTQSADEDRPKQRTAPRGNKQRKRPPRAAGGGGYVVSPASPSTTASAPASRPGASRTSRTRDRDRPQTTEPQSNQGTVTPRDEEGSQVPTPDATLWRLINNRGDYHFTINPTKADQMEANGYTRITVARVWSHPFPNTRMLDLRDGTLAYVFERGAYRGLTPLYYSEPQGPDFYDKDPVVAGYWGPTRIYGYVM